MSDPIHVRAAAVLSVGLMAFAQGAQAECSREDVQFYLDRGFTAEQVTQLCSPAQQEQPDRKYRAYTDEYIDREDAEYRARLRTEREVSLRSSIAAVGIALRGGHLYYTRKVCVSEGWRRTAHSGSRPARTSATGSGSRACRSTRKGTRGASSSATP